MTSITKIEPALIEIAKEEYLLEKAKMPKGDTLAEIATRIRFHAKQTTASMIAIGRELTKAKKLHSGEFMQWVENDLGMTIKTADSLMAVSHKAASLENFSNLPLSVAYLLASPSAPKEIVESTVEKATAGKKVTVAETKAAIKKAKAGTEKRKAPYAGAETKETFTRGFDHGPYKKGGFDHEQSAAESAEARKAAYAVAENGGSPTEPVTIEHDASESHQADIKEQIESAPTESQPTTISATALQDFKHACDEDLPAMTSEDYALARKHFNQQCDNETKRRRRIAEAEAKKQTASEGGTSVH